MKCRSCGAPIRWGITEKRRRIPLDLEPAEDGNIVFLSAVTGTVRIFGSASEAQNFQIQQAHRHEQPFGPAYRYRSHFATCPNAKRHRRKEKA